MNQQFKDASSSRKQFIALGYIDVAQGKYADTRVGARDVLSPFGGTARIAVTTVTTNDAIVKTFVKAAMM